ncbi:MAG: hypothetical protein ACO4BW_07465 [Nitriliruptoraceae bacterium]
MTPAELAILDAEARAWLLDVGADPDEVAGMAAPTVRALIDYHYEGGWSAFVADGGELVTP